jgi:hypothetical protein
MPCDLEQKDVAVAGTTLFSKDGSNCMKKTAVYFSPKHADDNYALNIVLWLHGFYVKDRKFLFRDDPAQLRQQVISSSKDVTLIAPFLGYEYVEDKVYKGDYSTKDLGDPSWGERYLNEVLAGIARFRSPTTATPPSMTIKSLAIACHSGGGKGMRSLVGTLGQHKAKLKECWGFDCLYGTKAPDDATFWYERALTPDACPLYIVYGADTLPQSVKLDLWGRGIITREGNKADPPGPVVKDLHIAIGPNKTDDVSKFVSPNVDDLMSRLPAGRKPPAPPAKGKAPPKPPDGEFLKQAIANLSANYAFPKDIHYITARMGLLSRLRGATFL